MSNGLHYMPLKKQHQKTRTKKSTGIGKAVPLAVRLKETERALSREISQELKESESSIARRAYLVGLPLVVDNLDNYQNKLV